MVCVVRVSQHAGNKGLYGWEPLDGLEPVCLVDGEAHSLFSYSVGAFDGAGERFSNLDILCSKLSKYAFNSFG
jgi:hypothetical protein